MNFDRTAPLRAPRRRAGRWGGRNALPSPLGADCRPQDGGGRPALERLRAAVADGARAAGFLSYEAGAALEAKLAPLARDAADDAPPLLWFGLFDAVEPVGAEALLGDPAGAWLGRPKPPASSMPTMRRRWRGSSR